MNEKTKELNKTDLKKVDTIINKWTDNELKDYYNSISENFPILNNWNYNKFKESIRYLILNDFDTGTPTIAQDYFFSMGNQLQSLSRFNEEMKEEETNELINFDEDNERFTHNEYNDTDYLTETLNIVFGYEISNDFKDSRDSTYINIYSCDVYKNIEDMFKNCNTKKEFFEEVEDTLNYVDMNDLKKAYIYNFCDDVFKWFCNTHKLDDEIKAVTSDIKKNIFSELEQRNTLNILDTLKTKQLKKKYENLIKNERVELKKVAMKNEHDRLKNSLNYLVEEHNEIATYLFEKIDKMI